MSRPDPVSYLLAENGKSDEHRGDSFKVQEEGCRGSRRDLKARHQQDRCDNTPGENCHNKPGHITNPDACLSGPGSMPGFSPAPEDNHPE
jgi:hypothetical protein